MCVTTNEGMLYPRLMSRQDPRFENNSGETGPVQRAIRDTRNWWGPGAVVPGN
jgi:hypothetical protein